MEEYYEGGYSMCRNPVIQKMFVFLGIGEKGGTGADVIAKGWKDNGWSIPTVEEKSNPDRIGTCLKLEKTSRILRKLTKTLRKLLQLLRKQLRKPLLQLRKLLPILRKLFSK